MTLLMVLAVLVMIAAVGLAVGLFRRARLASCLSKAVLQYSEDRKSLEQSFFQAAAASGKPRGLKWKECNFHEKPLLTRDRSTGTFYGLTGVTVSFEAIAGGDMEDVEEVANLRCATAVFVYCNGHWTTDGRVIFNLEPHEVLQRYHDNLEPVAGQDNASRDE